MAFSKTSAVKNNNLQYATTVFGSISLLNFFMK